MASRDEKEMTRAGGGPDRATGRISYQEGNPNLIDRQAVIESKFVRLHLSASRRVFDLRIPNRGYALSREMIEEIHRVTGIALGEEDAA